MNSVTYDLRVNALVRTGGYGAGSSVMNGGHNVEGVSKAGCARVDREAGEVVVCLGVADGNYGRAIFYEFDSAVDLGSHGNHLQILAFVPQRL